MRMKLAGNRFANLIIRIFDFVAHERLLFEAMLLCRRVPDSRFFGKCVMRCAGRPILRATG
jgi:hypothetical protein